MKSYNKDLSKIDKVQFVMVSGDRDPDEALAWAKKESFPWPTVLNHDYFNVPFGQIKVNSVPTYVLFDKYGNELMRGKKKVFKEVAKLRTS